MKNIKEVKNKKIIRFIMIFIAAILFIGGVALNKYSEKQHVSYITFLNLIKEKKIQQVKIDGSPKIHFKQQGEDKFYTTDNPRMDDFKQKLLLENIEVVEGNATSGIQLFQVLISAMMVGSVFYIVFRNGKGRSSGMMALGAKPIEVEKLSVGFKQIAGNVEAKEQVEDIIAFIKEPEKYTRLGARMPKGIIFYGPPGTGKTLMAKAIAKEASVPFFSISGSDFVQLYVGVGASRVREIFQEARKSQKAVIFIDEIDAIGKKRGNNPANSNDEKDQTLNALLTEMSGFKDEEGIIVIAATNRLDILDEALLRPGRFDRHVEIGYPDIKAREQIIKLYLKTKPVSESVKVEDIAKQTVYFTGAMIENLLNEAAILAANDSSEVITNAHIQKAFYIVVAGAEKKDRSNITQKDRSITAFHEAGHALITKLVAPENSVAKVTIVPTAKGAGGFSMNIPKDKMYMTKQDLIHQIQISLAGRAAEELIFGKELITTGASNDIEKATAYLKDYMLKYGMDEDTGLVNMEVLLGKDSMNHELFVEKFKNKMDELYIETKRILNGHKERLDCLSYALLEQETLEEDAIDELLAIKEIIAV